MRLEEIFQTHGMPLIDKIFAAVGVSSGAILGFISMDRVQSFFLFAVTFAMLLPRAITNWEKRAEWKRRQKTFREHEEKNGMKFCDVRDPEHLEMD